MNTLYDKNEISDMSLHYNQAIKKFENKIPGLKDKIKLIESK